MTMSDLICVMRDGRIVQYGTQKEIYGRPRNTYVAGFVGEPRMSMVKGGLEQHAEDVVFVTPDVRIGLGSARSLGLVDGAWPSVTLGVRSEDVVVHPGAPVAGRTAFPATVGLMEPVGSDTFVELDIGGATIVARVDADLELSLGQPVTAELRPKGIHLFDSVAGDRIVA